MGLHTQHGAQPNPTALCSIIPPWQDNFFLSFSSLLWDAACVGSHNISKGDKRQCKKTRPRMNREAASHKPSARSQR